MVKPAMKKEIAGYLRTSHQLSQRRAASLVQSAPSVLRYQSKRPECEPVRARLKELAQQRPRFGYRRLHVLLRREGMIINRKKTHRLYREEGLHLRPKRRRRITTSTRVAPEVATAANHLWIRPRGTRTSCMTT
jgi:putative transposase